MSGASLAWPAMTGTYWQSAADDAAMQDEHAFIWQAMLDTIDIDLTGRHVLDAGCNQGGFLRMLADACGIAAGSGYDPASGGIDDARRLAGDRPLTFSAGDTVPEGWGPFDVAFSHEVLYLLPDLPAHAAALYGALAPGAPYFAVMGVHAGSKLMAAWHASAAQQLSLPELHDLDDVAGMFAGAGFEVAVAQLAMRFVPVTGHDGGHQHRDGLADWLDYYTRDKVMFRFTRPATTAVR